jgi:hypothetical protein
LLGFLNCRWARRRLGAKEDSLFSKGFLNLGLVFTFGGDDACSPLEGIYYLHLKRHPLPIHIFHDWLPVAFFLPAASWLVAGKSLGSCYAFFPPLTAKFDYT